MSAPSATRDSPLLTSRLFEPADLAWLAVATVVAVVLRVAWVAYANVNPTDGRFDDSVFYHHVAAALAEGKGYVDPYGRGATAQWPPGYPAALAALYKPFGKEIILAKALNIAAAAVTVGGTYLLARQVFDRRVAFLAAFVLAFFPGGVYFSTLVYAESMFGALFMIVLLLAFVWTLRGAEARWWQVLAIGVLVGWTALVRAEGAFLIFVLAAAWALVVRPWRRVAMYRALVAVGAALALTPWTVRNALEFGEFIPLRTNAAHALASAADPDVPGIEAPRDEERSLWEGLRKQVTEPWQIFTLAGRKIGDLYENDSDGIRLIQKTPGPRSPLRDTFERALPAQEAEFWQGLADRYFFAAGSAAILGAALIAVWRRSAGSLLLLATALGWTLFFAFFNPVSRYHFPIVPVISILAAVFLVSFWDTLRAAWARRSPGAVT